MTNPKKQTNNISPEWKLAGKKSIFQPMIASSNDQYGFNTESYVINLMKKKNPKILVLCIFCHKFAKWIQHNSQKWLIRFFGRILDFYRLSVELMLVKHSMYQRLCRGSVQKIQIKIISMMIYTFRLGTILLPHLHNVHTFRSILDLLRSP